VAHRVERGADMASAPRLLLTGRPSGAARDQLHPLVVPQDSHTKHEPAGRIRTPQVEQ
jgi:hypothetical protein